MSDDDIALDEKRMYGEKRERTEAYVASSLGVTRVELAGDQIGRFSLVNRGTTTCIAGGDGRVLVGTEDDVLVGTGEGFAATGFGPAAAVALADGTPLAVASEGHVARLAGDDWEPVGTVTGPRRMDGDLLAAGDGVYRVGDDVVSLGGGPDVRDVAAVGPYAATADGLFRYGEGDGWHREAGGDCTLVTTGGGRVYAVGEDGLLVGEGGGEAGVEKDGEEAGVGKDGEDAREGEGGDWEVHPLPTDAALADIACGESLYAVTADGTVFVYAAPESAPDGQGGWRSRGLGVPDVAGIAVP